MIRIEQGDITKLAVAIENGCRSVAFPCISTGVYGNPIRDAAEMHPWLMKDGGSANRLHGINVVPMGDGRSRILLAGFNLYRFGSHDGIDDAMAWIGLLQMCWHTFCAAKLAVFLRRQLLFLRNSWAVGLEPRPN